MVADLSLGVHCRDFALESAKGPRKNNFTFSHRTWPQMCGRLQPARDFSPAGETRMNAAAGGLKPRRRLKPWLKPTPHGLAAPH